MKIWWVDLQKNEDCFLIRLEECTNAILTWSSKVMNLTYKRKVLINKTCKKNKVVFPQQHNTLTIGLLVAAEVIVVES